MIIAGTGHRPDKLGGYDYKTMDKLEAFALSKLEYLRPTEVISGMALGWDQALAVAALKLGIPYIAAIPFKGQESAWPLPAQAKFKHLCEKAEVVAIVSEGGYEAKKMQIRNQWMVKRCDTLLALWDGSDGGTANCIGFAKLKEVSIINVWPEWQKFSL